jgi:hypothetical protein
MSFCVSCEDAAVVCYCDLEKKITADYVGAQKECNELALLSKTHAGVIA